MKHIKQTRVLNCGQTCVAILLDKSIDYVEGKLLKQGRTTTTQLKKVLSEKYNSPPRLKIFSGLIGPPMLALVKAHHHVSGNHWVALSGSKSGEWCDVIIYDPSLGKSFKWPEYRTLIKANGLRVTSYLPLTKKGK